MHFLGKNLRHLRKQTSKTQSEIASLIQKGQTTIGNWENGISEPNLNELLIISNYFDIPLDKLLKTDLSEEQGASKPGMGRPYDHSDGIELSAVREKEENLTYVLREIKDIRSEMQQIYARLPARSDATDGEQ
jgi:transcriptional regulator with XRE-family HTH domain